MGGLTAKPGGRSSTEATHRWLFDLQAVQCAGSANRGVGRYSRSLFAAMTAANPSVDFVALLSAALPDVPIAAKRNRIVRMPALPRSFGARKFEGGPQDDLDAILLSHRIAPWKADLVHLSHVFEGFGERIALPSPTFRAPGQILSATLYDLIPLRFPDLYFGNPAFKSWYLGRLEWLRSADLLLAISESSRQDAIELLGIDGSRIVTVHGGIGNGFGPAEDPVARKAELVRRYKLRERFVLYTGGDDPRKNLAGAIRGFARIPVERRRDCQLVIVCSMDESRRAMYAGIGADAGLRPDDLVITGWVAEHDLVAFYQCCECFVFPSLYEGLGLPVIEAMACGAATIGGDNSSVRELVDRRDALFDASSPDSIAAALSKVLTEPGFADDLRAYGTKRAGCFTWERTAAAASEAFRETIERTRASGTQSVVRGWIPRKRLAILSPLPPCRSGIADYNATFLPYLARHFQIDLFVDGYSVQDPAIGASFPVFGIEDFEKVGHLYDAILYEIGNSEFHSHMLGLMERFPGVIGLHDAFLSGLYSYRGHATSDAGFYPRAMIESHGPRARRFFAPVMGCQDPYMASMIELPCTKGVLDSALGLISHSPFNLEVARLHHPEGWQAPYRTIPQMVRIPHRPDRTDLAALRRKLGFPEDALLVVTLGHVVWTKWGDRLLEAFLNSTLRNDPRVHLVYVGELLRDDFGKKLEAAIDGSGLGERIRITGFLDEPRYLDFLVAADLAVQLRTKSRGGTPKGVLDCLAHGTPVVINDDASYRDYPEDVVFKVSADPSPEQIADALNRLGISSDRRETLSLRGRSYVAEHHDPETCASMYAAAIHEFVARDRLASPEGAIVPLAPLAARTGDTMSASRDLVEFMAARPRPRFRRRKIFIDVSCTSLRDLETGIQRVVKKIVHHLYTMDVAGVEAIAVELTAGRLHVASRWLTAKGLLHPSETDSVDPDREVEFGVGDILFMLDSSWARYPEFFPWFDRARAAGATVMTAIYDLLPLQLPDGFIIDGGPAWFRNWVRSAVNASDALVAISRSVAVDVKQFIETESGLERRPEVGFWHLGSDLGDSTLGAEPSTAVARVGAVPYLLMVGTIEPRKSHGLVLDTMERLWANGCELRLCIAGKEGWLVDALMERLRSHEQSGRMLHFFEHPSDADITQLYEHASALLFISKGEGFGLPLVEAANHGTPILCSDLPVFREICGSHASYTTALDPATLAAEISAWWKAAQRGDVRRTDDMPRLTWEQSARSLLDVLVNEEWI